MEQILVDLFKLVAGDIGSERPRVMCGEREEGGRVAGQVQLGLLHGKPEGLEVLRVGEGGEEVMVEDVGEETLAEVLATQVVITCMGIMRGVLMCKL